MFAYSLLVHVPGSSNLGEWELVRPGPDMEIPTIVELQEQVKHDIGFVPAWLGNLTDPAEYIQVEDEHLVVSRGARDPDGVWFVLDIEGSQDHVLPPLAERIACSRVAKARAQR